MENKQTPEVVEMEWLSEREIQDLSNKCWLNFTINGVSHSTFEHGCISGMNLLQAEFKKRVKSLDVKRETISHHQEANAKLVEALRRSRQSFEIIKSMVSSAPIKNTINLRVSEIDELLQTYETK